MVGVVVAVVVGCACVWACWLLLLTSPLSHQGWAGDAGWGDGDELMVAACMLSQLGVGTRVRVAAAAGLLW